MHGTPGMADVRRGEAGELERRYSHAGAVRLLVSRLHAARAGERRKAVVVVERTVLLAVDDDMLQRRGLGPRPSRAATGSHLTQRAGARQDRRGHAERAGSLQEGAPVDPP